MLKLTKKADYGLIALRHLAMAGDPTASSSAKQIAEQYGVPLPLLSKVLQRLARSGFLESLQGTNGGYRLARPSHEMSVLDVIHTIDGPVILTSCFHDDQECDHTNNCTVREPLRKVHEAISNLLSSITIADISSGDIPTGGAPASASHGGHQFVSLEELVRS
ncbi:MAG: SUF system Fe-S cluster assembly regulator [Bryobacterales bacterium]|jgi:Rrf2 family protein|nr:SUF system Fe-S cluster assembly regulator [Bryobacterales bacterium]